MRCDDCGVNEATVNITLAAQEGTVTRHLCAECATAMQQHLLSGQLAEILKHVLPLLQQKEAPAENVPECPECAMTFAEFEKSGRLGCPECYKTFAGQLRGVMKKIHGVEMPETGPASAAENENTSAEIETNAPESIPSAVQSGDPDEVPAILKQLSDLKYQIRQAIADEQYEEAARLKNEWQILLGGMKSGAVR